MKKECSIVRDLLPLFVEDMVSADTGEFVKEHLEGCVECREEYKQMKEVKVGREEKSRPEELENRKAAAPLVNLKRKLWKQKVRTVACTALFVAALFLSAFAVLSIPVYFPYTEDLLTVTENSDGSVTIIFDEIVTEYRCEADVYGGWEEGTAEDVRYYQVEAWTSLWSKWFSKGSVQAVTIPRANAQETLVYYTSNDGHEDVCVYGEPVTSGGVVTLPGHVLSYYFVLAVVCVGVLFVIWLFVRRKAKGKNVIETILYYPISYCIAHVIIAGFRTSTYTSGRDFMFILLISILIYGGVLLARSAYRERKEIKVLTERN